MKKNVNGENVGLASETAIVINGKNVFFNVEVFDENGRWFHVINLTNEVSYREVVNYLKNHYSVPVIWDGTEVAEVRFMGSLYFSNHCVGVKIFCENGGVDELNTNALRFCESARNLLAAALMEYVENEIKAYYDDDSTKAYLLSVLTGEFMLEAENEAKKIDDDFSEVEDLINNAIWDNDLEPYVNDISCGIEKLYDDLDGLFRTGRALLSDAGKITGCDMVPDDLLTSDDYVITFKNGLEDLDIFSDNITDYFWGLLDTLFENCNGEYLDLRDTLFNYLAA